MERPVAARADNEQIGVGACLGEAFGGATAQHHALGVRGLHVGKCAVQLLLHRAVPVATVLRRVPCPGEALVDGDRAQLGAQVGSQAAAVRSAA